jgi:hypothetical protein
MNYPGTQYTFSPEHGVHIGHQAPIHYPHTSQSQHLDRYFLGHSHGDFADFAHHSSMMEEYEDGAEHPTRPRLTKDQVDVLESQFQAQPKPNSNVKRQLAVQTNLSLPRVAVSFFSPPPPKKNTLCNFKKLTGAELVSESPSKGQTTEEARRIREQKSIGRWGGTAWLCPATQSQYHSYVGTARCKPGTGNDVVYNSYQRQRFGRGCRMGFAAACSAYYDSCSEPTHPQARARTGLYVCTFTSNAAAGSPCRHPDYLLLGLES